MTDDHVIARVTRLCLLTDARKARRAHRATAGPLRRLWAVTARLAAMEGRHD